MATVTGQDVPSFAGSSHLAQPDGGPVDQIERDRMVKLANEAAERLNFHSVECERWERTGRAAMAAVVQFDSANPVAEATIERFIESPVKEMGPEGPSY